MLYPDLDQIVLVDDASNHTDISTTLPLYISSRLPSKVAAFNISIIKQKDVEI